MQTQSKAMKDFRKDALLKRRLRGIGLLETLLMQLRGRRDGVQGLPAQNEEGRLASPRIDQEVWAFNESTSELFARFQLESEQTLAQGRELVDSICRIKQQLSEAERALKAAKEEGTGVVDISRKVGEESLSDVQVRNRRAREKEASLYPLRNSASSKQAELEAKRDELSKTCSLLREETNTLVMISSSLASRLHQRLDAYWRGARLTNPNIPATPPSVEEVTTRAAEAFNKLHHDFLTRAAEVLEFEDKGTNKNTEEVS